MTPSDVTARRVFVGLLLLALLLVAVVIRPFAAPFFLAAVLAGALEPLMRRLKRLTRGRAALSAGALVLGVVLVLVLPLAGIATFVVREGADGYRYVAEALKSGGASALLERLPDPVERQVRKLMDRFDLEEEDLGEHFNESLGAQVQDKGGKAAQAVVGGVAATGSLLIEAILMLIALYFFLVDGPALVAWAEAVAPLKPGQTREILVEFRKVSVAVMTSSAVTAAVQAVAALVGYFIARVPHALFFGLVTFVVALVPAVGAAAVCLAAALLLFATGHTWAALFLAIWGVTVVGLVDNIVKPMLVKRGLTMHGAVVFFALLGGLAVFGTIGILLGPMIVAFLLALIRIHQRDYGAPEPLSHTTRTSGASR